jgi:thiol:disulfide interchange protein
MTRQTPTLAFTVFVAVIALAWIGNAQTHAAGRSADSLVADAVSTARAEGKTVLIEFGASWCSWCKRFEAFVNSSDVGSIVRGNYVVVNLTVRERAEKKALETPGGDTLMHQWGGDEAGLPFYVFLDRTGKKIADSNAMPDGTNIGFPGTEREADAFMTLISRTAPKLQASDRPRLIAYLKKSVQQQ